MTDNFEFRSIHPDEVEQAIAIEQICFPPNEACSPKAMTERIAKVPQLFLVAIDKSTGKLAGFLNGVATDEEKFRDEFFTDIDLCDENGKNVRLSTPVNADKIVILLNIKANITVKYKGMSPDIGEAYV